jgi:hypothetical protein
MDRAPYHSEIVCLLAFAAASMPFESRAVKRTWSTPPIASPLGSLGRPAFFPVLLGRLKASKLLHNGRSYRVLFRFNRMQMQNRDAGDAQDRLYRAPMRNFRYNNGKTLVHISMNAAKLNSVISRARRRVQSVSLEGWKVFFEIGGVVLLALTFVFGAGAWIVNNRLNVIQKRELKDKDVEIESAKSAAALANERASKLESANLTLRTDLEHAKAEADKARLELRRDIDQKSGPRKLNWEEFKNRMKDKPKGGAQILYKAEDTEAFAFAREIAILLASKDIGWKVTEPTPFPAARGDRRASAPSELMYSGTLVTGLTVHHGALDPETGENTAVGALMDALMFAREGGGVPQMNSVMLPSFAEGSCVIFVGQRQ